MYADVKTVNHSLEWVTADGVSTNLGEAYNGILKTLGSRLNIWKGGVQDEELAERWQELAWRVSAGFHRQEALVRDKVVASMGALAEMQRQSGQDGSIPIARRVSEMTAVPVPGLTARVCRFPAKRTSSMRQMWRTLRERFNSEKTLMDIANLSKQDRWYVHQWCNCYTGLRHWSTGEGTDRILHLRRGAALFRKQMQDTEEQRRCGGQLGGIRRSTLRRGKVE